MADKIKDAMKDLSENKSRAHGNGNRTDPKDNKGSSDAQHGQTDVDKARDKAKPPQAKR